MRLHRLVASWKLHLLGVLALLPAAACNHRTDVQCGTDPVLIDGKPTGFERCSDGVTHRAASLSCANHVPRSAPACVASTPADAQECSVDADCTAHPFGFCKLGFINCDCSYGCQSDADCPVAGQVCVCGDPVGTCAWTAVCHTDTDCPGSFCTVNPLGVSGTLELACLSPDNECEIDADCAPNYCMVSEATKTRKCHSTSGNNSGGRPFLVEGSSRVAPLVLRDDWRDRDAEPRTDDLSAAERAAIADGWARAGLFEHASIASFARFTLQLLSLGAPPELVRDSQVATADEIEHARLCFALASAYGGRAVGPAPLAMGGALKESSPPEVVEAVILEGCVGETIAAIEAAEMAHRAIDPAVRRALETIADDETRHAELAWRVVKWMLASDPSLASVAARAFAAAIDRVEQARPGGGDEDRSAYGLASEPLRSAIARQAVLYVVKPCAEALLLSSSRSPSPSQRPHPSSS